MVIIAESFISNYRLITCCMASGVQSDFASIIYGCSVFSHLKQLLCSTA